MMKIATILILLFCVPGTFGMAQDPPDCIKKLNNKTDLTTIQFERVIILQDKRAVYEFSVQSVRRCMDCFNGSVYYDKNCKQVAGFLMGRGANQFVAEGYTAGDFGMPNCPIKTLIKSI